MDTRQISEEYTEIMNRVLENYPELNYIRESQATIICLTSEHEKKQNKKTVFAECEKIPEKYKWSVPCDFTITVFLPNVERFTEEQKEILMYHELLHVGIDVDGNEEKYRIIPHDIEEFRSVIEQFGLDWAE